MTENSFHLEKFYSGLEALSLALSDAQIEQFLLYYKMLTQWNQRMNLTAITEFDDVVEKHFLDSLSLVRAEPSPGNRRVIDVGTGAGFPGLPLKIAFPGMDLVLVDAVGKKLQFLNAVTEALGLFGVVTVHGRAEDLAQEKGYRQAFDLCVSRAVADLAVLSEYCLPFVRTGGSFIAYKSAGAGEECAGADRAIVLLGGEVERITAYTLPESGAVRSLVSIKKKKGTPRAYPRKAGTPERDPLQ